MEMAYILLLLLFASVAFEGVLAIFHGNYVEDSSKTPYMAYVEVKYQPKGEIVYCSGILVGSRMVLTAGQCFCRHEVLSSHFTVSLVILPVHIVLVSASDCLENFHVVHSFIAGLHWQIPWEARSPC